MASDILEQIVDHKRIEVQAARKKQPLAVLKDMAQRRQDHRSFLSAMGPPDRINIIAEIKRASPSKGDIRADLDPASQAAAYERGGAAALSVLTDAAYFKGSLRDMTLARQASTLPVLRKDFILSDYQVYESAAAGADAILLIVRILPESLIRELMHLCGELNMDALVEVHTEQDLETAVRVGASIIGINNRNLKSFDTDIQRAMKMAARLAPGQIPVAASGISSRADIESNLAAGIRNFLIGERLMRADDPEFLLQTLING